MGGGKLRKATTAGKLLDIALKETGRFAKRKIDARIARAGYRRKDLKAALEPRGVVKLFAAAVLTRLAARSVPGAVVAGGAVIAKALWDRRNSADEAEPAPEAVDDRAS